MSESDHNKRIYETRYTAQNFSPPPASDYFGKLYRIRLELAKRHGHGRRILDVGCGGGAYLLPLLHDGENIVGLDFNRHFLDEIRSTWRSRGMQDSALHLVQADAREIPFDNQTFNLVFAFSTLYSIPDFPGVLSEFARILQPGGIAILDIGNTRSLNAIEASRIATGVLSYNVRLGTLPSLLGARGLQTIAHRSFQVFPLYGGATPLSRALNAALREEVARESDGIMLDERVSSDPITRHFAFRHLLVVEKMEGPAAEEPSKSTPLTIPRPDAQEPDILRQRSDARTLALDGRISDAVHALTEMLQQDTSDISTVLAIAALYDHPTEQEFVSRSSRTLDRWLRRQRRPVTPPMVIRKDHRSPRVSVVLPTYNHREFLPMAVFSVLGQTYEDYELIIVDDGSTDDTGAYLMTLDHPRVRVLRLPHQGLPGALNAGFRTARGELLTWISADNFCSPLFLDGFTQALDALPDCSMAVSAYAWTDSAGRITGIHRPYDLSYHTLLAGNPGLASFMYRRSSAATAGDYDVTLEGAEDWDMWLRLVEGSPAVFVPEILYYYRRHDKQMSATRHRQIADSSARAFWRAFERKDFRSDITLLFPLIEQCRDQRTAELHARWEFGTGILQSPFGPPGLAVVFLEEGFSMTSGEPHLASTLAVAYARAGRMDDARMLTRQLTSVNHPAVQSVCTIIGPDDVPPDEQLLRRAPLFTVDKSSSELFRLEQEAQAVFEISKGAWVPRHSTARGSHA